MENRKQHFRHILLTFFYEKVKMQFKQDENYAICMEKMCWPNDNRDSYWFIKLPHFQLKKNLNLQIVRKLEIRFTKELNFQTNIRSYIYRIFNLQGNQSLDVHKNWSFTLKRDVANIVKIKYHNGLMVHPNNISSNKNVRRIIRFQQNRRNLYNQCHRFPLLRPL